MGELSTTGLFTQVKRWGKAVSLCLSASIAHSSSVYLVCLARSYNHQGWKRYHNSKCAEIFPKFSTLGMCDILNQMLITASLS